ncbi:MAG: hypothetical protein KIH08_07435 [Candidatus Freyarchaeota archaeon]|nr:hypothetical protein [Candidatus Jordarchaeia archaeon]MBS7269635.1 hypothetical protein [Candidatus Jordarchaeia archaeon]MBS7280416.1 hypothetical protein [Candidatus Jordarchaeia archaeon]
MSWKDSIDMKNILSRLLEGKDSPEKTQEKLRSLKLSGAQKVRIIENEIQERKNRLTQMDRELQTLFEAGKEITDEQKIAYERLEASIRTLETQKMLIQNEIDALAEKEVLGKPLENAVETQTGKLIKTVEELRSIEETKREIKYETKDIIAEFDRKFSQRIGKQQTQGEARKAEKAEAEKKKERMYTS